MNVRLKSPTHLTAQESAELAGVSLDTIEKYVQIGLLNKCEEIDGLSYFNESDIRSLFYTRQPSALKDAELPPSSIELAYDSSAEVDTKVDLSSSEQSATQIDAVDSENVEVLKNDIETNTDSIEGDSKSDETQQSVSITDDANQTQSLQEVASMKTVLHIADNVLAEEKSIETESVKSVTEGVKEATDSSAVYQSDNSYRLQNQHLLDVNNELREQISTLKQERDWLRNRIEQLELRGEREQMLLLSESETVRRLVSKSSLTERVIQTLVE